MPRQGSQILGSNAGITAADYDQRLKKGREAMAATQDHGNAGSRMPGQRPRSMPRIWRASVRGVQRAVIRPVKITSQLVGAVLALGAVLLVVALMLAVVVAIVSHH